MIEIKHELTGKVIHTVNLHTLRKANLSEVDLSGADLSNADLRGANLSGSDLSFADLSRADLRWANLKGADLSWAYLQKTNLTKANLSGANLKGANLSGAKSDKYQFIGLYGIGSNISQTLFVPEMDKVWYGYFTGSLAEFEAEVQKIYKKKPKHLADYMAAIAYFKHFTPC